VTHRLGMCNVNLAHPELLYAFLFNIDTLKYTLMLWAYLRNLNFRRCRFLET
jgi:hypothetical protein